MYNGNYKVASLVYIYNVYVCSKTIFSPVLYSRAVKGYGSCAIGKTPPQCAKLRRRFKAVASWATKG